MKTYVHAKTCTWMFIEIFSSQHQIKNNPIYSSSLNKVWYIHTMEYCSAIKRSKLLIRQQPGWISKELCWVTKANQAKNGQQTSECQGLRRGWWPCGDMCVTIKGRHERSLWWWKCIWTVAMSVSWLWYCHSFARCYHWGNWIKCSWDLSALFLTTLCEYTTILK